MIQSAGQKVYSEVGLKNIYNEIRSQRQLPKKITPSKFIELVVEQKLFEEIVFTSRYSNPPRRYAWGDFSIYELALSIRKDAYISHGTAAFLHGLTDSESKTIYLNKEQSAKPSSRASLTQEALNKAFSRKQRHSQYVLHYDKSKVTLLSGKNTGRQGVEKINGRRGEVLEVTNIERTLIDITVRPGYAGGVQQVLRSYVLSKGKISPLKLVQTLKDLNYVYPYHQAVGFYLQKAGFDKSTWVRLREQKQAHDFFLAHQMEKQAYDPEWHIYYPKGLHI